MKNNVTYQAEDFIEAEYTELQQTRQFVKACKWWKRLLVNQQDTDNIFDAQRDSLHDIGVANSVIKEQLDNTTAELYDLKAQMVSKKAVTNKYYAVLDLAMSTHHTQDTEDITVMLQATAVSAQNKQYMTAF